MMPTETETETETAVSVNGTAMSAWAEPRTTLADFLRDKLRLTGTHLGCEHGVCGACTVLMDGRSVRSCLVLAVQAQDHEVSTIEGVARPDGTLDEVQRAFSEKHGLQCGFCTPGFIMATQEFLQENGSTDDESIRAYLGGNICRCTGYSKIVEAVRYAAELRAASGSPAGAATNTRGARR
jgi:carbon-monoxide dehydrogenase small subunit